MSGAGKFLGASTDTWVKLLAAVLAFAVVTSIAWSFSVENRVSQQATRDWVREQIGHHVKEGPHKGAVETSNYQNTVRRLARVEVAISKTDAILGALLKGLEEIKRDLRMLRRERTRRP